MSDQRITSFTDLVAWQKAHKLVVAVYEMLKAFPDFEQYGLANQMRRSAVSVTSNIAEGFTRSGKKEKVQFYAIAKASLTEMQNQLLISKDVGYIKEKLFKEMAQASIEVGKLITGLQRSALARKI